MKQCEHTEWIIFARISGEGDPKGRDSDAGYWRES